MHRLWQAAGAMSCGPYIVAPLRFKLTHLHAQALGEPHGQRRNAASNLLGGGSPAAAGEQRLPAMLITCGSRRQVGADVCRHDACVGNSLDEGPVTEVVAVKQRRRQAA